MGLIGVSPPTVVRPKDLRVGRRGAANGAENAADPDQVRRAGASLARRPESLALVTARAENCLRSADDIATSRVAQRFAPRPQPDPQSRPQRHAPEPAGASVTSLAAGMRRLAVLLVLATLLPNLTAAALWLGLIAPPWAEPATQPASEVALPVVQPPLPLPVLSAPSSLDAETGGAINFAIALDGTDGVPTGSVILVKGLPHGARLSSGAQTGKEWQLTPGEIGDLYLALPQAAIGDTALAIQLVAPDGRIVADASTLLKVAPAPLPEPAIETVPGASPGKQIAALEGAVEATGALPETLLASSETTAALPEAVPADPETPPLPDRRPEPAAQDWVAPSAYVNLRQGPSSTAAVVAVVAKGAKLRVIGRKRGWVQISNPANAQTGWIYSSYLAAPR